MSDVSSTLARKSTENILGFSVENSGIAACVEDVLTVLDESKPASVKSTGLWLACLNPHSYVAATKDPSFSAALKSADWLIPDGIGIAVASRLLKGRIRNRITGSDVFREVMREMDKMDGCRVFFLGSTEQTLRKIRGRAARDYPNISIASFSPPFKARYTAQDLDNIVERINAARPHVLWVGLTAPKQEKLLSAIIDRVDVKFAAAIGAVFDFYACTAKRSHPVFQRAGMEWLPRLLREPRRLWRRTFVSAPIFLWHVLVWKFRTVTRPANWQDPADDVLPPPAAPKR